MFRKPRTSDLEPSPISPVPPVSLGDPAGVFSFCPKRVSHRSSAVPKWFSPSLLRKADLAPPAPINKWLEIASAFGTVRVG